MSKRHLLTAAALALAAGAAASAQPLSLGTTWGPGYTFFAGAGAGFYFNITATNPSGITIHHFDTHSQQATIGAPLVADVYAKAGQYQGFETSAGAWTLLGSVPTVAGGQGNPTEVLIGGLYIPSGETYAIRIGFETGGVRYNDSASYVPSHSNADVIIFDGAGQGGLFTGTPGTPRSWNGTLYYEIGNTVVIGACCLPDGTCTEITETMCLGSGGTYNGNNTTCASIPPCPQPATGACCLGDGSCVVVWEGGCLSQGGIYRGDNTTCASACNFTLEVEPNNSKVEANVITLASGEGVRGLSTGTVTTAGSTLDTTVDYYRIKTSPAPLGIYRHEMLLRNSTTGNSAWLRGLTQTGAAAGPWPGPVGTATTTESTGQTHQLDGNDRINIWYGFGREEEVYYRISGAAATTGNYLAELFTMPVTPTNIGSFNAGTIIIDTSGQGHTNDTHLRIYDGDLNPIVGYANDGASINGGAPANSTTTSYLSRDFTAGTYYMAIAMTNLATDQGAPCDDNVRTGPMMDFPNIAVDTGSVTTTDVSFSITDSSGPVAVAASRDGRGEIAWFTFTVTGTILTGACCFEDGTCQVLTPVMCTAQGGTYAGDDVTCAAANCPQPGACCVPWGCAVRSQNQCATLGGTYKGNGTECATANCPPPTIGNIIGFNFCSSSQTTAPQNWTRITAAGSVSNVPDDTGTPTTVGLTFSAPGTISFIANSAVGATATPQYVYDLSSMNGYAFRSSAGTMAVELNGLTPNRTYQYWFVAHRASLAVNNIVEVSDGDVLNAISFNQTHTGSWFSVNPTLANNTMDWNTLAQSTTSSSTGTMTFNVGASADTTVIAALAIREVFPTTQPCYANCDGSTTVPILNVADFGCFLQKFAAGCE